MLRKITAIVFALVPYLGLYAQQHISFADPEHWTTSELNKYKGQTVVFDQPVYTCNNYSGLTASLHRVMSPTNQYEPTTAEYNTLVTVNNNSTFYLNGLTGYHRMGETIYGLKATINSATSLTYISSDAIVGTRLDTEAGYPTVDIARDSTNTVAVHNLLVCAANLEYYLVENLGTGYGADNASELQKQHTKIMAALSKIRADIYGFVEIEQGQAALQKLATALTQSTGRHYTYINDGGSSNGSYTKSGYVYKTTYGLVDGTYVPGAGIATSKLGLDKLFPGSQINAGIVVAVLAAIAMYILMNKTTLGYELKACGANRHAARYAGIRDRRNIVLSMAIAGALAAGGAALYYLSGNTEFYWTTYQSLPSEGFNGIPVALLALNNPIGVVFSGIFMAMLDIVGLQLTNLTAYNEFITDVIISVIVYLSAFSLMIRMLLSGRRKHHEGEPNANAEPPAAGGPEEKKGGDAA